ncbi:putative CRM domain-containing protein [Nymphaea thermarum]|nr:putative CRM domain-containing protein [Nymphaea thermarum]
MCQHAEGKEEEEEEKIRKRKGGGGGRKKSEGGRRKKRKRKRKVGRKRRRRMYLPVAVIIGFAFLPLFYVMSRFMFLTCSTWSAYSTLNYFVPVMIFITEICLVFPLNCAIVQAKKKVALLLQKLKKYELPELPPPRHDPELLTPEQLQAYKKIGFRNRNYVPVGVRGVFGGVVQNMHLHWKFHETVQVCCDNFPKEKIKEMATMLARLSGGIVVNVHDVKTIIMFRGRNYRQPKNLIPINTLTKRKALFKARFEQALDSQKLNIKKLEQQLRQMGVNPEDPIAMASVQRVASTFFRAIDEKQGTPYVFQGDRHDPSQADETEDELVVPSEDSDQEELDRFIAEIEDAADQEWAAEEAAEKEEVGRIRYWNEEDIGGRSRRAFPVRGGGSDDEGDGQRRDWRRAQGKRYGTDVHRRDRGDENGEISGGDEWDPDETNLLDHGDLNSDFDSEDDHDNLPKNPTRRERSNRSTSTNDRTYSRAIRSRTRQIVQDDMDTEDGSASNGLGDNWESEDSENEFGDSRMDHIDYYSSSSGSDEE